MLDQEDTAVATHEPAPTEGSATAAATPVMPGARRFGLGGKPSFAAAVAAEDENDYSEDVIQAPAPANAEAAPAAKLELPGAFSRGASLMGDASLSGEKDEPAVPPTHTAVALPGEGGRVSGAMGDGEPLGNIEHEMSEGGVPAASKAEAALVANMGLALPGEGGRVSGAMGDGEPLGDIEHEMSEGGVPAALKVEAAQVTSESHGVVGTPVLRSDDGGILTTTDGGDGSQKNEGDKQEGTEIETSPEKPSPVHVDAGAEDPIKPLRTDDKHHEELMYRLNLPRIAMREDANEEIAALLGRRAELAAKSAAYTNAELARMQGGGSSGGLLAGLGSMARSIGGKVSGNKSGNIDLQIGQIDAAVAERKGFRRIVLDRHYPAMTNAASEMYSRQKLLNDQVGAFNSDFEASPEGQNYLRDIQGAAKAAGMDEAALRSRIADTKDTSNPMVNKFRDETGKLCSDPKWAGRMGEIDHNLSRFKSLAEKVENGISNLNDAKVDLKPMSGVDSMLEQMDAPNLHLSKPGASNKLDKMSDEIKDAAGRLAESIKRMVENLLAALGLGRKS